ncbi:hypothetical protein MBLNU457_g0698t2 [Dothideomycetes sp. NU457]
MPYPFNLPTTSNTHLASFFTSPSHPSLILTATTYRSVVRDALKKHKRLAPAAQASNLSTVQDALASYISILIPIYTSITGHVIAQSERVSVTQIKEFECEWRCTLTASIPGREPARVRVKGIHNELAFVLQTLAYTYTLQARTQLHSVYTFTSSSPEARAAPVSAGMRHLLDAHSVHSFVSTLPPTEAPQPADITASTSSALASLALAEATIIVVLKDDPYAAAVADDRNKDNKDWMISAPSIPKVRAHLFARLSLAASDHAAKAAGLMARTGSSGKIDDDLLKYTQDLRRTARGKAARFLGIDAEISGKAGEGIAWLRGAKRELGLAVGGDDDAGKRKGLKGLKQSWSERKEDKRIVKATEDWGMDAGRLEEARVVEWLEAKWVRYNDMINVQTVPPFEPLLAAMPSGREYHTPKPYIPPTLDAGELARMRAPPDPEQSAFAGDEDDSGDEGGPRPKSSSLHLESLHHIDSLVIRLQLCSPRNNQTALRLAEDGKTLSLHHDGQQSTIGLPVRLSSDLVFDHYLPESLSLHSTLKPEVTSLTPQTHIDTQHDVPWSANDLGASAEFKCETCDAVVVKRESIKDWRNLPSEGWAEMMDLWHCHKPDEHEHDHAGQGKGYASNSKLLAKRGVGLVDTLGFLLSEEDCSNVKISNADDSVACALCSAHIGQQVPQAEGIKLFKPFLSMSRSDSPSEAYEPQQWFAGQLLAAIESTGARRFYTNSVPLSIWVFMPNVTYACSIMHPQPTEGIKVLYQVVDEDTHAQRDKLGGSKVHTEDLGLPAVLERSLLEVLKAANEALPTPAASFVGWNTAYLPHFHH